jgi:hypothetical protein
MMFVPLPINIILKENFSLVVHLFVDILAQ